MCSVREVAPGDRNLLIDNYRQEIKDDLAEATIFADDLIERFNTLVCITEDRVIGSVTWDTRGGREDGIIELVALGVNRSEQRKGIATRLVESMIEEAKELYSEHNAQLRFVYLFMERKNKEARQFYESIGFKETCKIPEMYLHDDASLWTLYVT